jgi:hypothetical protein
VREFAAQEQNMGGRPILRVLAQESPDIVASLLGLGTDAGRSGPALQELIREKYNGAFSVELSGLPASRSDVLLQQLEHVPIPESLRRPALEHGLDLREVGLQGQPAEESIDVVVLSILPDLQSEVWRHERTGLLVQPPAHWDQDWTPAQKSWFSEAFTSMGPVSPEQFRGSLQQVVRSIKRRLNVHVIVYSASPIDPGDDVHNYHGVEDTFSLRVHRFNHALAQLSVLEGISIVDAERIMAEHGEEHLLGRLRYSDRVSLALRADFLRILEDIGFFEARPLMLQLSRAEA